MSHKVELLLLLRWRTRQHGDYLPHRRRRKIMTLQSFIPLKARTGMCGGRYIQLQHRSS